MARDSGSGKLSLWVRPLGSTSAHRLDKTEEANFPFWSPDSQSIGFFAEEKLKRVSVSGGSVQTICNVPRTGSAVNAGDGGTWNREGVIVFGNNGAGPLMKVPAVGGVPAAVTAVGKDEQRHSWPQFLPDGRHLLYFALGKETENSAIYVQELGSAKRVPVMKNTTRGGWAPPGYLLFVREGTLFAQHLNAGTFQVEGEPLAVAQEITVNEANGRSAFAVSQNGVLAYRGGTITSERQLTWRGRDGKVLGVVGKTGDYGAPTLSPDEKSAALQVGPSPKFDAWVMDLASGVLTRMTREGRNAGLFPAWSPDSQRLAVTQNGGGIEEIAVASGRVTPLTKEALQAFDWSPDGRSILCTDRSWNHLALFPLADGAKPQTILDTPYRELYFRFSRDGKYVVYESNESGPYEIYLAAFPSFAVKRKVSTGGGDFPVWARGGQEILYRARDGTMMSVEVRTTGSGLEAGIPKPLFKFNAGTPSGNAFGVTADGQRFLVAEPVQGNQIERPEIPLVLNWAADIK